MPLPEKVVEQLTRETPKTPGWAGQLLMFSTTIFFLSIFAYTGMKFGYLPYLDSQLKKLDSEIQSFSRKIPAEEQARLIGLYSQLTNLSHLLKNHNSLSRFFDWLERSTEINVYFSKLSLNASNNQVSLGGVAKNIDDFVAQLQIFQKEPNVERVSFSNLSVDPGGFWRFDLNLFLKPDFLLVANSTN